MKKISIILLILLIASICFADTNKCDKMHFNIEATYKNVTNNVLILQQFYYWDCSQGILTGSKDIHISFNKNIDECPPNSIIIVTNLHYIGKTNDITYYKKCLK